MQRILSICIFLTLSSLSLHGNEIHSFISEIENTLAAHEGPVRKMLLSGKGNDQYLHLKKVVEKTERFLKSNQELLELSKSSHALSEFYKRVLNDILHVSLKHEIEESRKIKDMYPHDLPFRHSGEFPAYPTYEVLEKIKVFLQTLSSRSPNFSQSFRVAQKMRALQALSQYNSWSASHKAKIQEVIPRSGGPATYYKELVDKLRTSDKLLNALLAIRSERILAGEQNFIQKMIKSSLSVFLGLRKRSLKEGPNFKIPEFKYVVQSLHQAVETGSNVFEALKKEPRLFIWRNVVLEKLEDLTGESRFGYRDTHSVIAWASEFLDIVDRTILPEKSNPLHYAKRYQYFSHYVLDLVPNHFAIPTSSWLETYDLLSIGSAPLGFSGIVFEGTWVDSYYQTPNEFRGHDEWNHERRRYQFTQNYRVRLGISRNQNIAYIKALDEFNSLELMPMIKRIDPKFLRSISKSTTFKQIEKNIPGAQYFKEDLLQLKAALQSSQKVSSIFNTLQTITEKKKLLDIILFEVVHEDALAPSPALIIESLLRKPNLPMPRDFIDISKKTAYHSMEPAGTTMAYIIHKLNGSFYDTPAKRMDSLVNKDYRTPKKIIEATSDLIFHLGGYKNQSKSEILKQLVYLTITDEGFLSYFLEEFQKDLHPIQKSLNMSLKYAEGLEALTLIDEFPITDEFTYYLKTLRSRIKMSIPLSDGSNSTTVEKVQKEFKTIENSQYPSFESLQDKYFKIAHERNEVLYKQIKQSEESQNVYLSKNLKELKNLAEKKREDKNLLVQKFSESKIEGSLLKQVERLTFDIEEIETAISRKEDHFNTQRILRENEVVWNKGSAGAIDVSRLRTSVSKSFHDKGWRPVYQLEHGPKEYYRQIPKEAFLSNESPQEALTRFQKKWFIGLRVNEAGNLEQNINTDSDKVIPELFKYLNYAPAKEYIEFVTKELNSGAPLTQELINRVERKIHNAWMYRNKPRLSAAFTKLGLQIDNFSVDQVIERVSSMTLPQWSLLTPIEVRTMRQFAPSDQLLQKDRNKDIKMALIVIEEVVKEVSINNFLNSSGNNWKSFGENKTKNQLVDEFWKKMHDEIWRPIYRAAYGDKPNEKEVPKEVFLPGESTSEALRRLNKKGTAGLRINSDNVLVQDINLNFKDVLPELNEKLSKKLAVEYVDLIYEERQRSQTLSYELVIELASKVHKIVMEHNIWQLKTPFSKIGIDVQNMTLKQVLDTVKRMQKSDWLAVTKDEQRKIKQFVPAQLLNWENFRKDVEMVFQIISPPNTNCKKSLR